MSDVATELREDDIFRWQYREPGDDRTWGRYHCCSRIGIVRNGRLRDTYWMIGHSFASDGRSFGADELHKLELTRLGNLADLQRADEYQADYYDDADIVNLNHSNSPRGNFYLHKGAKRSAAKMIESAQAKLGEAEAQQRVASFRAGDLRIKLAKIEAGEIEGVYI